MSPAPSANADQHQPLRLLVTGGAGYVGSHVVRHLLDCGDRVTVLDDLSEGHRAALPPAVELVVGDIGDRALLAELLGEGAFDGVLHFAARCYVGESVHQPLRYYRNNVARTVELLDALCEAGVSRFVFSSTCATYGDPVRLPMDETHPQEPINPYGRSKLVVEGILRDLAPARGLHSASLRYFNAAGAHPSGELGEDHEPETHLIPLAIAAAAGTREELAVYGDDYPTPDGTCIRDYVHVCDLAEAHRLALLAIGGGAPRARAWNLGTGVGSSVREVLNAVERVVGRAVPHRIAPRREGDPPVLVADGAAARAELGWSPRYTELEETVRTAWEWHRRHPEGFGEGASC